jgi:flagellar hook-associated protein 3 FlgL
MNVTQSYLASYLNNSVETSSSALSKVTQELSTGLAVNEPSDNPSGTDQILTINDTMANVAQYQADATSATNSLSYTDSQLESVQNLVTQARTIAVAAASSGTESTTDQASNAQQISSIITAITNLANTQLNGNYIFSGTATTVQPYTPGDTTYTYNGNTSTSSTAIGPNQEVTTSTPGSTIFQPILTALSALQTDITAGNSSNIEY